MWLETVLKAFKSNIDNKNIFCFPHSWLITGFVISLIRWVSLVEQELLTLSEHLSSSPVFSGVRVTRSLVLCVCFADRCLPFCPFSFDHCVVCPSSIYEFWSPFWYLQTLFAQTREIECPVHPGWYGFFFQFH